MDSRFYKAVLDSMTEHVVVIDETGDIKYVNKAWVTFGTNNEIQIHDSWDGQNYLDACDAAAQAGEAFGLKASVGIRKVINREEELFYFEYPCHCPAEQRWFTMRITPLECAGPRQFVISHQNITKRKQAEDRVRELSLMDALTGLANRRYFDEFLEKEWRRAIRAGLPLSLIMMDIDHFKLYNDNYGHHGGDECLKRVGECLSAVGKRPSDLVARYGGEEFAVILGSTSLSEATAIAEDLCSRVHALAIRHDYSTAGSVVTVSVGAASIAPDKQMQASALIEAADSALYHAKENGRNRIAVMPDDKLKR